MEMVVKKSPGKTADIGFLNDSTEPIQEIIAVYVVLKNYTTFNSSGDDVM